MLKVGDGTSNYSALKFIQAVAADVPDWAKTATFTDVGQIPGLKDVIDAEISEQVKDSDTKFQISV